MSEGKRVGHESYNVNSLDECIVCLFVCLLACLFVCLSACLFVCLFVFPSGCLTISQDLKLVRVSVFGYFRLKLITFELNLNPCNCLNVALFPLSRRKTKTSDLKSEEMNTQSAHRIIITEISKHDFHVTERYQI